MFFEEEKIILECVSSSRIRATCTLIIASHRCFDKRVIAAKAKMSKTWLKTFFKAALERLFIIMYSQRKALKTNAERLTVLYSKESGQLLRILLNYEEQELPGGTKTLLT